MSNPEPLRLALIGLGRMGAFHLGALGGLQAVQVVAAAEPSAPTRARLASEIDGLRVVEDPEALLDDDRIEAWLISAPTPAHPELTRTALDAGLHVLCEKPLALDPEVGDELGDLAARRDRILQVGFWRRFAPPWAKAQEAIRRGDIGSPLLLRLSQWDADPPPATFCDPEVSGGLAIDCGVHEFDLAEWLTGLEVQRVRGFPLPLVDEALGEAGDLDNLLAVLHLEDGPVATVDLSRNARYGDDVRTEILGSDGALLIDTLPSAGTRLGTAGGMQIVEGSQSDDAMAAGVAGQAAAFAAAIRGRDVEIPGPGASTRSVRIGRAVIASAAGGHEITIPPSA